LFLALAEGLKVPMQQIARQSELEVLLNGQQTETLGRIQSSADMMLHLLDSYLMSLRVGMMPEAKLLLEPVSVAAVLHETAEQLRSTARQYGVELHVHVDGRYEPVLANHQGLRSALVSLGYSLVEALPATGSRQLRLHLASHRTKHGIVAGMYGELHGLTPHLFRRSKDLAGQSRQPLVSTLPNSGAGVFVADAILQSMSSHLRVGRFHKLPGFAATLSPSEQLQLV